MAGSGRSTASLLVPGAHPERGRVRAALLLRPNTVVCGVTAARLHRLDALPPATPDEPVHLLAPPDASHSRTHVRGRGAQGGCRARRRSRSSRGCPPPPSGVRLPTSCSPPHDRDGAVSIVDAALHDGTLADLAEVRRALVGRRGAVRSAAWLRLVDGRSESPLETRLRLLLTDAGFPPEQLQWPVVTADGRVPRLDLAWPSRMVCVEADGAAFHSDPHALYRDRHSPEPARDGRLDGPPIHLGRRGSQPGRHRPGRRLGTRPPRRRMTVGAIHPADDPSHDLDITQGTSGRGGRVRRTMEPR